MSQKIHISAASNAFLSEYLTKLTLYFTLHGFRDRFKSFEKGLIGFYKEAIEIAKSYEKAKELIIIAHSAADAFVENPVLVMKRAVNNGQRKDISASKIHWLQAVDKVITQNVCEKVRSQLIKRYPSHRAEYEAKPPLKESSSTAGSSSAQPKQFAAREYIDGIKHLAIGKDSLHKTGSVNRIKTVHHSIRSDTKSSALKVSRLGKSTENGQVDMAEVTTGRKLSSSRSFSDGTTLKELQPQLSEALVPSPQLAVTPHAPHGLQSHAQHPLHTTEPLHPLHTVDSMRRVAEQQEKSLSPKKKLVLCPVDPLLRIESQSGSNHPSPSTLAASLRLIPVHEGDRGKGSSLNSPFSQSLSNQGSSSGNGSPLVTSSAASPTLPPVLNLPSNSGLNTALSVATADRQHDIEAQRTPTKTPKNHDGGSNHVPELPPLGRNPQLLALSSAAKSKNSPRILDSPSRGRASPDATQTNFGIPAHHGHK